MALLGQTALADDRHIAPSDVLGLRVTDWQAVDGELREWTAITGTYTVGADGSVVFPYIGQIAVAGQSPGVVGDQIGEALKQRFALPDRPFASISIDTRAPVLVGGAVERPGEVPYVAGMTPRHAVALAGGVLIPTDSGASIMVQSLTAEAQVRILTEQVAAATLRVARLRAELDGEAELALDDMPAGGGATAAALLADAERHLQLNRERLERELALEDSRIALLNEEVVALQAKEEALGRQNALAEEQRNATKELSERGLAANARLLDAERTLVTVETQILDVATALLEARQALETAKAKRVQLVQDRGSEIMSDLHSAEVELAELREKLSLQRSVAGLLAAGVGGELDTTALSVTVYRGGVGGPEVMDGLDTALMPGDLVEVTLAPNPLPSGG
jgi:protein involved in polysaccharide export with SLBB domain